MTKGIDETLGCAKGTSKSIEDQKKLLFMSPKLNPPAAEGSQNLKAIAKHNFKTFGAALTLGDPG